jgi:hypothetical protein
MTAPPLRQIRAELVDAFASHPIHAYPVPQSAPQYPCVTVRNPTQVQAHRKAGGSTMLDMVCTVAVSAAAGLEEAQHQLDDLLEQVAPMIEEHDAAGVWDYAVVTTWTNWRQVIAGDDVQIIALQADIVITISSPHRKITAP